MNENSKGNSNRNPEQSRLDAIFQERERLTWEQYRKSQEPMPLELKERQKSYRAEVLRNFISKNYPHENKAEAEAHLRQLLGEPEPVKKAAAPIRKPSTMQSVPVRNEPVPKLYEAINKRIASSFGIKLVSGNQIQYR